MQMQQLHYLDLGLDLRRPLELRLEEDDDGVVDVALRRRELDPPLLPLNGGRGGAAQEFTFNK